MGRVFNKFKNWFQESVAGKQCQGRLTRIFSLLTRATSGGTRSIYFCPAMIVLLLCLRFLEDILKEVFQTDRYACYYDSRCKQVERKKEIIESE